MLMECVTNIKVSEQEYSVADPLKPFFFDKKDFCIFPVKFGHFTINDFFLYVTNKQA